MLLNRQGAEQQRMPFSLEIKNAVKIPQEVNQHKLIIHLRLLTNVARILPPLQVVR